MVNSMMPVWNGYWRGVLGCKVFQSHLYLGNHISNTIQSQDCPSNSTEKNPPNLGIDAAMTPTRKKSNWGETISLGEVWMEKKRCMMVKRCIHKQQTGR